MGSRSSKTRPSSRNEVVEKPPRPKSSTGTRSSFSHASKGISSIAPSSPESVILPPPDRIDVIRKVDYRPLQDPDQTVARRFQGRTYLSDSEEGSQLGQESTLRNNHGSGNIQWNSGCGLVGLRNLGNTCYMNSILQCICHSPGFSSEFVDASHIRQQTNPKSKLRGKLSSTFSQLVQRMRTVQDHSVLTPADMKTQLGRAAPGFSGYGQQDAQEFLRLLLEGLNQDLNRITTRPPYKELSGGKDYSKVAEEWFNYSMKRDDSIVTDYFRGQLLTVTTCGRCKEESVACDTFLDLSIPIPSGHSSTTLLDCLQSFTSKSYVEGFKCERCHKTSRSQMQMTLWRPPKLLVIHLKRFSSNSWRREKVNTEVKFPLKGLDMGVFAPHSTEASKKTSVYDLFAVSHHVGDLGFGHYFSDCLHAGKWYRFDDSTVSRSDLLRIRGSAYVLFYSRCDFT